MQQYRLNTSYTPSRASYSIRYGANRTELKIRTYFGIRVRVSVKKRGEGTQTATTNSIERTPSSAKLFNTHLLNLLFWNTVPLG